MKMIPLLRSVLCAWAIGPICAQQFSDLGRTWLPDDSDPTYAVLCIDLDGDGVGEIIAGNGGGYPLGVDAQNRVYRTAGRGAFTDVTAVTMPAFADKTAALAGGDVDGDGDADVVVGNFGPNRLLLNDGTGRLVDGAGLPPLAEATDDVVLVDVDLDGDLDLVVANNGRSALYRNDGAGNFVDDTAASFPPSVVWSTDIDVADLDGDGDPDLAFGTTGLIGGLNVIYLNDGAGHFTDPGGLPYRLDATFGVAVGDFDSDGSPDLFFANRGANRLLLNDGTLRFHDASGTNLPPAGGATEAVIARDVDDDGDIDLILAERSGAELLLNDGAGVFSVGTGTRLIDGGQTMFAVTACDLFRDQDQDLVFGVAGGSNVLLLDLYRQIDAPRPPVGGEMFHLDASAKPGFEPGQQLIAPYASAALAASPLVIPPLGEFHLDLGSLVVGELLVVPPGGGRIGVDYAVPPGLRGQTVYMQAMVLHGPAFEDWRFTNVLEVAIP